MVVNTGVESAIGTYAADETLSKLPPSTSLPPEALAEVVVVCALAFSFLFLKPIFNKQGKKRQKVKKRNVYIFVNIHVNVKYVKRRRRRKNVDRRFIWQ